MQWLGECQRTEAPFVAYHAAVALLMTVRSLKGTHRNELRTAIDQARRGVLEHEGALPLLARER